MMIGSLMPIVFHKIQNIQPNYQRLEPQLWLEHFLQTEIHFLQQRKKLWQILKKMMMMSIQLRMMKDQCCSCISWARVWSSSIFPSWWQDGDDRRWCQWCLVSRSELCHRQRMSSCRSERVDWPSVDCKVNSPVPSQQPRCRLPPPV